MKPDDVIDKFWPRMTAEQIIQRSLYLDDGTEKSELKELVVRLAGLIA